MRDQYFYLRLVATAVYESLKQGLRPIADLDKGGSEWLVLIIVLHWFIVLKLLQALQAGAHVLLIILPLGLLWWTLWHVFAERSHFGYFWRWPY